MVGDGSAPARMLRCARIVPNADRGEGGPGDRRTARRNADPAAIGPRFTTTDTRAKLRRLDPMLGA